MNIGDRVRHKFLEKETGTVVRLFPDNRYNLLVELDTPFHHLVPTGEPPMKNWAGKDVEKLDEG